MIQDKIKQKIIKAEEEYNKPSLKMKSYYKGYIHGLKSVLLLYDKYNNKQYNKLIENYLKLFINNKENILINFN